MKVISESVIKSNTGKAFPVKKGQIIRVIGESTADYVVFNLHNVKERFDQARTKVDQGKIYVTTGDVLISKYNNVMMTIVKDTYKGTHDMEKGDVQHVLLQEMGRADLQDLRRCLEEAWPKDAGRSQTRLLGESRQSAKALRRYQGRCSQPA